MDKGTYLGLISVIVMIAFFAACIWALLPAQKKRFDEAAQLPLDEEDKGEQDRGEQDRGKKENGQ